MPVSLRTRFGYYQQEIDHTPARLALAKSAIDSAFRLRRIPGEAHWRWLASLLDIPITPAPALKLLLLNRVYPINPRAFELAGLIDREKVAGLRRHTTSNAHLSSILENIPKP